MSDTPYIKTLRAVGRRPNKAAEPSLFLPHEDTANEAERKAAAKAAHNRKSVRVLAVVGAALVWLPILFCLAYTVVLLTQNTQGAVVYGIIVLSFFWILYIVGVVLLFLCARKLRFLRRATLALIIIWVLIQAFTALMAVLCGPSSTWLAQFASKWLVLALSAGPTIVWYLCLAAAAVLSVLLLVRAFSRQKAAASL